MDKRRSKRPAIIAIVLLILAILIALAVWYFWSRPDPVTTIDDPPPVIEIVPGDTAAYPEPPRDTIAREQPSPRIVPRKQAPPPEPAPAPPDTADTVAMAPEPGPCAADTSAPWVYPDPSGGLHRGEIAVRFHAVEPCTIEWRLGADAQWRRYGGEEIPIQSTTVLRFRAIDTCGNRLPQREEAYEIEKAAPSRFCPPEMEYVAVGATRFCIDRYEWPNAKGRLPQAFVSWYQAMDSCFSVDKRLCSSDEWIIACSGPYGWKYPYSQAYEPHACWTHDSTARRSGSRRECRGYFDVYDMSGNLAEWTSTRSPKNAQFYNVMGGFWESGSQSGCGDARYSYYPQNRHNPVGFRCCKDAVPADGKQ